MHDELPACATLGYAVNVLDPQHCQAYVQSIHETKLLGHILPHAKGLLHDLAPGCSSRSYCQRAVMHVAGLSLPRCGSCLAATISAFEIYFRGSSCSYM
jgi:hypothetical protein